MAIKTYEYISIVTPITVLHLPHSYKLLYYYLCDFTMYLKYPVPHFKIIISAAVVLELKENSIFIKPNTSEGESTQSI